MIQLNNRVLFAITAIVAMMLLAEVGVALVVKYRFNEDVTSAPPWLRENRGAWSELQGAAAYGEVRTLGGEETDVDHARMNLHVDRRNRDSLGEIASTTVVDYGNYYRQYLKQRLNRLYNWQSTPSQAPNHS